MSPIELSTVQKRMLREFAFRPLDALHFCSSTRAVTMAPKSVQLHINVLARAELVEEISGRHFQITHAGRNLLDNWNIVSAQSNSRYEVSRNGIRPSYTGNRMGSPRIGADNNLMHASLGMGPQINVRAA